MVIIYTNVPVRGNAYTRGNIFRVYDFDEVPDDLDKRVQQWANRLKVKLEVVSENNTIYFYPAETD